MGQMISVPCGQCSGCRSEKAKEWAARCYHESTLYDNNCFITLTYSPEKLPLHGTLIKSDFQKFIKKLRKSVQPKKIRYFGCGEYGEKLGRPHYHGLIFNHDFDDKKLHSVHNDEKLFVSRTLTDLWGHGHASVGTVTVASAGYVARYTMKKITGKGKNDHYRRTDEGTGETVEILPEFNVMSLKPGIGAQWFERYSDDVFPDDFIVVNGRKHRTPGYYLKLLEKVDPEQYENIKAVRLKSLEAHKDNNTPERLAVREIVQQSKSSRQERRLK